MTEPVNQLWRWASEEEAREAPTEEDRRDDDKEPLFLAGVKDARSGKEFFERAHDALPERLAIFDKGREWGRRLVLYAMENPKTELDKQRPIIQAIEGVYRMVESIYTAVRADTRWATPSQGSSSPSILRRRATCG